MNQPSNTPVDPVARRAVRFLVFSASLRDGSYNSRLARLAAGVIDQLGGTVDLAAMKDFDAPSYNFDVERDSGLPEGTHELCRRLDATDAFVIASPEYNGSIPGLLKNAIDWASRRRPQPFNRLHGLLVSASPSMVGGNRGLWALRVPLEHLGTRVYPDMFSLARAHEAFDESGGIADVRLAQRFEATIAAFIDLVEAAKHYPCARAAWVEFLGERPDPAYDRVE